MIRDAEERDLPVIHEMVNYYIEHTNVHLANGPMTMEERMAWWNAHGERYPVLVEELDGQVIAYASLSQLYAMDGYDIAAELSVYVAPDHIGKGSGSRLLAAITDRAVRDGKLSTIISKVTAGNEASDALHKKFGYEFVGTFKNIAKKKGELVDVNIYQTFLGNNC